MRMLAAVPLALVLLVASGLLAPAARANGLLVSREGGTTPARTQEGAAAVVLRSHRVTATLEDHVAQVTVEQVFRNRTSLQLEGDYLFPLPEGAIVSDFAMTMGDRLVKGEILEAERARAIYEGIVRRRRDPGLLEYVGRGLFRARVFPIPPQGDVTIQMEFQQVLPEDGGLLELRYPLATDRFHGGAVDEVVLDVTVRNAAGVRTVYSPSHEVEVVRDGPNRVRVSYEGSGLRQTRDFLMYVGRSDDSVAFSALSHKPAGERGTFLSIFAPPTTVSDAERAPKDVIYVLDTSGSMSRNQKIDQARRALDHGVNVLGPEDRFNIVTFATEARAFREGLIEASPEARSQASRWIAGINARGGTDIGRALSMALAMGSKERLLLVVLLSDGRPTVGVKDADALVKQVEAYNASHARVFTFGLGFDLDVGLLDRIAETTGGARDYVAPQEDLEIVTSRFFAKVGHPVLTDVEIDFGPGVTDVYPRTIRDLFAGGRVLVFGRYESGGPRTVTLRGKQAGKEIVREYPVQLATTDARPYLPRLWAHRKVAFLLDAVRLHGEEKEVVDEIVALATRHGIVTPYTSGLVVEEGELERARPLLARARHGRLQFRGPGSTVPPGLREPVDPSPPPPPPPGAPPTTPPPTTPGPSPTAPVAPTPTTPAPTRGPLGPSIAERRVDSSKRLREMKERTDGGQGALEHELVRQAGDKTFVRRAGVWTDSRYDAETMKEHKHEQVEAWSDAWLALAKRDARIAKYLALGEQVLFVFDGVVYVVTAPKEDERPGK